MNKLLWALFAIATIVSLWGGFAACIVIIFFAKILGKLFLRKEDEYYDAD
jgi:hypothetical protein